MRKTITGITALALALGVSIMTLKAQTAARNVWDGVYSADQAAQGKDLFANKCATCHGADLNGAEMAPPLVGATFLGDWVGQSMDDLFTRIHTTMPANDPGSLSNAQTAQVLSYILQVNQFPAGSGALPSDDAALGQIAVTAEKPAK
ncbi:MAG TPA: cytochrome c [Rhizomicrobium sp.]|jgi:mono/diheme cytochrome c family protein